MNPKQSLEIQLVKRSEGTAIQVENVLVEVQFFVKGQFVYAFNVGRTTIEGSLTVTYDCVEELRQKGRDYNLMDYGERLDMCDPTVTIILLSDKELRERSNYVHRVFQKTPDWAEPWPSNSRVKAEPVSVELREQITQVQIPCELVG
jgi:hypothetical protein